MYSVFNFGAKVKPRDLACNSYLYFWLKCLFYLHEIKRVLASRPSEFRKAFLNYGK
jgi:hypothetical protein